MIFCFFALGLSLLAVTLLLAGGPGYRLGLWGLGFGLLGVMRYAMYLGIAGALMGLLGLCWPKIRDRGAGLLLAALVIGITVIAVPIGVRQIASSNPPIHDISTDLINPPEFVAVAPLRSDAPNSAAYPGEEVASQQRKGYPDLRPVIYNTGVDAVFEAAVSSAEDLGWTLVAADIEEGRIEATDTTLWYGFKDDIVVRIQETPNGTQVDVRSKSRVGQSDLGKNAARIQQFLEMLDAKLGR